jgi:ribulose-5-phosphate 4-epimerase/fuculose-1-phosphate aldolase
MENSWVRFDVVFCGYSPPEDERNGELIDWCRRLDRLGLAPESAGNLSFRTGAGFIITASGIELKAVKKGDLVEVLKVGTGGGGMKVYARGRVAPSKESVLHSVIYRLRTGINAVFHTHDRLVLEYAGKLKLPCTEGDQPRGSYELAREAERVLSLNRDARYLVLRDHGFIALGETMAGAGRLAEEINQMVRRMAEGC